MASTLVKLAEKLFNPLPGSASFQDYVDPEGMPERPGYPGIKRHHAADWFGSAGTSVVAPESGVIVEANPDTGCRSANCQVFGGTTKLQTADGRVWVFRHTSPKVRVGQRVTGGEKVAEISNWPTNPKGTHAHVELWRTLAGGYYQSNAIDPIAFLRTGKASPPHAIPGTQPRAPGQVPRGSTYDPSPGGRGSLGGPIRDAGSEVWDAATAIPKFFGWIFGNWDRILLVFGGSILLLVGMWKLAGSPTPMSVGMGRAKGGDGVAG